ncbi:MAG: hypothetical protein DWQ19_12625 [Crenarchaeota archaeon]|nr:MAG: hypothetical protein DWQ19_12625 [Thermoproteota archaeon]
MPPFNQETQQDDPVLQELFQPVNTQPEIAVNQTISKGSLVMFQYSFWIHDPTPLVVVTDFAPGHRMRGVNLHYLTFPYVKNLLTRVSAAFSYQTIKGDAYINSSFRTYKWAGIQRVKIFNTKFVLQMMSIARTFDPYQIRAIRQSVEQQLQQQIIGKAQETVEPPSPQPNQQITNQGQ